MKVYKRGNRWWFYGQVDGSTMRYSLGPDIVTADQAKAWLERLKKGSLAITLQGFFNDYLIDIQTKVAQSTQARYKRSLRAFEAHFDGHNLIGQITTRDINQWAAARLKAGVSPEGVNIDLRHVKAALKCAERWELITKAPLIEMVKTPRRLPRHLTKEQFLKILSCEPSPDYRRLWSFMVWTGVRRSEALGLCWDDINLDEMPSARVIGKGDRQRIIPLLPPAVEALGVAGSGLVFGFVGHPDNATHRFHKAARAAGVKAKLHDLRHTTLTWFVAAGVPLKLVQDVAGHSSITTTMNYAKKYIGDSYQTLKIALNF